MKYCIKGRLKCSNLAVKHTMVCLVRLIMNRMYNHLTAEKCFVNEQVKARYASVFNFKYN